MGYFVPLESRQVVIAPDNIRAATEALWRLGVSTYASRDQIMALIRLGQRGSFDRAAIYQVELRLGGTYVEQVQWLNMCLGLPSASESLSV